MNRILIITLIAATLIAIPENVGSVQTGPFVDVTVSNSKLEVGKETTVTVFVYELEGEDQVPKDLIEVTMTASMGSFESDTGITNHNGYCTFTYHAPDDIDGPTDVQINATAEIGALNYIGRAEILVSYKLVGRIEGPSMLKRGSPVTTYIVNVTANGEPMENVNIMPTVFGKGSMDSYSRHTGPDGKGSLSIIPSDDSTGKITIMIQLGLMDYLGVSVSRFIQVVEELSPLNVTVSADHNPLRWGSCHLTARVSRGDYPESGVTILWEVSSGYVLRERTKTNESGESRVILTTLPEEGMNWPDHIVVNVTASQLETVSYAEENIPIEEEELSIDILHNSEFKYRVKHSQLYPGEDLVLDLNLFHREYQYHDWEWVWGMKLDLTLYYGEEVIFQSTLESDLHTIEETIVEVDRRAVWTVPDDITDGNYTWSLLLTDRDSNHAYWSYQADKPLLLRRQGRDDWTIMYFFAGRNNLAPWFDRSLKDLKKKAPDGEYKVLCNYDRSNGYDDPYYVKWDGTKYFDLEEGYSKEDTMFGPNSGDPDNLVRFMEWATAISTTGRYCLVYCDHGAAHRGIGVDEYWNDHLTIGEFENGLESFSGIRRDLEVLVMDACHMASLEVANYLSDYTGYQVFSQLTIYSDHSFDNERALKNLNQYDWESSKPSPLQVATAYLNSFIQVAGGTEYDSPAMVLDSEKGYQLAHLFNEAMRSLYLGWDTLGECFDAVFEEAQRLEGPYSDQWNLTDMKNMLILLREELSDYVLDPAGRSAFNKVGEVISYFDSVRAYYHPMGDLNGLNVFLPDHMEPAESPFREGLSLIGHHDHDYWLKVLDVLWHGNYHREEMLDPLQVVEYNVIEEEGEPSIVQVNLTLGEQRPETVFIRATQWSSMGSMGNLSAMSVIEGDDLDRDSLQVILRVPETDLYSLSVTALDENGDVITNKHLGHRRINGSDTDPPKIELESSSTEIEAGEMITFNCTTEEGGNIYWDLDSRDGIYIEGTGASIERGYRKPGNLTVTCMVNSEDGVTVDHIDIRVLPPENNSDPMPVLTYRSTGGLNYTLNGSESLDPDGDPVQYRFNFGDGNWTGWMDECSLTHRFGGEGTYNCSLKVRDSKGGVSDRTFILLEALESPEDNGSINEPPVAVYEEKITFHIDEKLVLDLTDSYDPEGEKLSVLVQWGDGKITDWTTDLSLEHSYDYTGKYIIKFEITDESNNSVRGEIEVIAREPYDTPPPPSPDYSWQVPLAFLFAVLMSVLIVISIAVLIIAKRQGENLEE